jgi:DNA-binding response OmpR family regulator
VYVGYLRRKLEAAGAGDILRTVRGHGYVVSTAELDAALGHGERG